MEKAVTIEEFKAHFDSLPCSIEWKRLSKEIEEFCEKYNVKELEITCNKGSKAKGAVINHSPGQNS